MSTAIEERVYAVRLREVPPALAQAAWDGVVPVRGENMTGGIAPEQARALVETGFGEPLGLMEWSVFYMQVCADMFEDALARQPNISGQDFYEEYVSRIDGGVLVLMCLDHTKLMRRVAELIEDTNLLKAVELGERRHRRQRKEQYAAYLDSPEWQARRAEALLRAGNRCQLCNRRGGLHVHHRTYARVRNERPEDLIVLCADCHQAFHDRRGMPDSKEDE